MLKVLERGMEKRPMYRARNKLDRDLSRVLSTVKIENMVATAALNQRINLSSVCKAFPSAEYRPEQFPGLFFKLKKPKTATLIFSSGKMVCTGARSERQAKRAVNKVIRELSEKGIVIVGKLDVKIQNIVASASLGRRVNLEDVIYSLGKTTYEPEQFPGLIYRIDDLKVVVLIFSSGKLILAGAKKVDDIHQALNKLEINLAEKEAIKSKRIEKYVSDRINWREQEERTEKLTSLNLVPQIRVLTSVYILCEFCNHNCSSCPYPNLGIFLEEFDTDASPYLAKLTRIERCDYGYYLRPVSSLCNQLKSEGLSLEDFLNQRIGSLT